MIAIAKPSPRSRRSPAWHHRFLAMLPTILSYARSAFLHLKPEAQEDAIQEVVANCLVAFAHLVKQGKADVAYPTVPARYGIAQLNDGRRVGNHRRVTDVLSTYAQRKKGFVVKRLDHFDEEEGQWREAIVEDDRTPPPDQAAFRVDFPAWLLTQTERDRRIAEALAVGHSTGEVAGQFEITPGRVSQLRREFCDSWHAFHGEPVTAATDAPPVGVR